MSLFMAEAVLVDASPTLHAVLARVCARSIIANSPFPVGSQLSLELCVIHLADFQVSPVCSKETDGVRVSYVGAMIAIMLLDKHFP